MLWASRSLAVVTPSSLKSSPRFSAMTKYIAVETARYRSARYADTFSIGTFISRFMSSVAEEGQLVSLFQLADLLAGFRGQFAD